MSVLRHARCLILSVGLALAGTLPASAQTFDQAVRSNIALAISLCVDVMFGAATPAAAFVNAGFAYRGIDRGVNSYGIARGTGHYFDAPANTTKAQVLDPNQHPGLCSVFTTHMGEAEVATLIRQVLFIKNPGTQVRGPTEWFMQQGSGLPLIVTVNTIGTNNRYEAPGTVQVSMVFPG